MCILYFSVFIFKMNKLENVFYIGNNCTYITVMSSIVIVIVVIHINGNKTQHLLCGQFNNVLCFVTTVIIPPYTTLIYPCLSTHIFTCF